MGGKTFDLVEYISDLLRRIGEGRQTFRDTQNVRDDFRRICVNRDTASQLSNDLQLKMVSLDEPAKSQAKAEGDRQRVEFQMLNDEASSRWPEVTGTTAFIDPFHRDVLLLFKRLPLEPHWDVFHEAVGRLDVRDHGCWTDPPANLDLETLEMRLRGMLDLARGKQRGHKRRLALFPTPNGALWKDVSITFISDHRVQIAIFEVTQTRSYAEMGFEDRRGGGGKSDSAWECLRLLAQSAGTLERPVDFKRPGWIKAEKQVQAVRERLKELFTIPGDPLPFRKRSGYEAQFKIQLGKSIEH